MAGKVKPKLKLVRKDEWARCKRCNRVLRNEDAIARGYGPVCFRKTTAAVHKELEEAGQIRMEGI